MESLLNTAEHRPQSTHHREEDTIAIHIMLGKIPPTILFVISESVRGHSQPLHQKLPTRLAAFDVYAQDCR